MTCLMWNVYKYICVSSEWNRYETGMKQVCQLEKNAILTFYVKEPGGVPANTAEKKVTNTASPQKKIWGNTDIAI